ncbi:type I 3-dehydroquinate dehydratase [Candidatus Bathyarchaeota archaeon]|nr:type I 3-dehydroquinate dehydratase [Candidatus Bathyarchaeota archaeon]
MIAKICVSIIPKSLDEALRLIEKSEERKADFIEVRLDYIGDFKGLRDIAECTGTPLIATVRAAECCGKFEGEEEKRMEVLLSAASSGFKYVDIELHSPQLKSIVENLLTLGVKPIISFHDFKRTPEKASLQLILKSQMKAKAYICKIVTTAQSLQDNLTLLQFLYEESGKARIVCFAMGPLGKLSRLLSPIYGGYFTIASLDRGFETATGQMTIEEMKTVYKALGIYDGSFGKN